MKLLFYILPFLTFGQYPDDTQLSGVNYISPSAPEYLESFIDFGNKITRISDLYAFDGDKNNLRHEYSILQAWNADGSLLHLYKANESYILNGETYEIIHEKIPLGRKWANTNPDLTYWFQNNTQLFTTSVSTLEKTIQYDFADDMYTLVYYDAANCELSSDDQKIALMGFKDSAWYLFLFNYQAKVIEAEIQVIGERPDSVKLSYDKQFIVSARATNGNGDFDGVNVFTNQLVHQRKIYDLAPHSDLAVDINSNQVWVANVGGLIKSVRLDNGDLTNYVQVDGGHISGRGYNRPGWVYVTDNGYMSGTNSYNSYPAFREVFALKLDEKPNGIITVNRFAKHYSDPINYNHQPQACPNRDGTKVIFASNMEDFQIINQDYPFAFVVESDKPLSAPKHEFDYKRASKRYYDMMGKELKSLEYAASGVYIIKYEYEYRIRTKKIIN